MCCRGLLIIISMVAVGFAQEFMIESSQHSVLEKMSKENPGQVHYIDGKNIAKSGAPDAKDHHADESPEMWRKWSFASGKKYGNHWSTMTLRHLKPDSAAFCAGSSDGHRNKTGDFSNRWNNITDDDIVREAKILNDASIAFKSLNGNHSQGGNESETAKIEWLNAPENIALISYLHGWLWVQQFPKHWPLQFESFCNGFMYALGLTVTAAVELTEKEENAISYYVKNGVRFEKKKWQQKIISETYLAEMSAEAGVITLENGLRYQVLKSSRSASGVSPNNDSVVALHILAKKHRSIKPLFDTNGQDPIVKVVRELLPGLREGVLRMKIGEKWRLTIPPHLGYGDGFGLDQKVYPFEVLIYEVELLNFEGERSEANSKDGRSLTNSKDEL